MKRSCLVLSLVLFLFIALAASAQNDATTIAVINGYMFAPKFDDENYTTRLDITRDGKIVDMKMYQGRIGRIEGYDLDSDGHTEAIVEFYSGGAHCCTTLEAYGIANGKVSFLDSIYWGNGGYVISDLNGDNKYEVIGDNDMFAYAFTSYAGNRTFLNIYNFSEGKFVNVTDQYAPIVRYNIISLKRDLDGTVYSGVDCGGTGTGADPGEVKTILAAILASYASIGEAGKGYELIESRYNCADKQEFINTLNNEFKLK